MDETEYEEYANYEGISKSDFFLKAHYEELFYMTPKELAVAINAMNEDELIQFNQTIHKGHGMNVCLMRDKLDVFGEYQNLNSIFIEAYFRISIIHEICSLPDHSDLSYKESFHKIFNTFKDFIENDTFNALEDNQKQKPDMNFLQYVSKTVEKLDMSIKEFPKNTTEKEKDILNHLSCKFQIKRELSPNGLLPLFLKTGTKRLLAELYKCAPDYQDYQVFNFIKSSIETNLPDATLQNYCREVRKDVVKI